MYYLGFQDNQERMSKLVAELRTKVEKIAQAWNLSYDLPPNFWKIFYKFM